MTCSSDRFEPGVDAQSSKHVPDVVPDRFRAQVELLGDLLGRLPLLQMTKNLGLTGCQMRVWRFGPAVDRAYEQPEDPDHPFAAHERYRADLEGEARPVPRHQNAGCVRRRFTAEHLPGEELARARAILGRDDRREVPAANITDETLGCRVDPADPSCRVEHVARDANAVQSTLDIAADQVFHSDAPYTPRRPHGRRFGPDPAGWVRPPRDAAEIGRSLPEIVLAYEQ
jgi:hypothetical protein